MSKKIHIEARLSLWVERGLVEPTDTSIAAEIQFGLVESALRDCFLRRRGEDEERYVREVTRCPGAYVGARLPTESVATPE